MTFPVASRGRYDDESMLSCRCFQGGTVIMTVKFGIDWTMCIEVKPTSCFMVFYDISAPCHENIVWWKLKLLITFNDKGLKMVLTKVEVDRMNALGEVKVRYLELANIGLKFHNKCPTTCWILRIPPGGFFVVLEMLHKSTKFNFCTSKLKVGGLTLTTVTSGQ